MSEAELIFNRANVALSRSQKLIASWLPEASDADNKSQEQLRQEEDEVFTPIPEKLGLGAPLPQKQAPGSANRSELDSNNRLRKHLLGADRRKALDKPLTSSKTYSKKSPSRQPTEAASDLEPDLEDSRSSLGKRKRKTAPEEGRASAQSNYQEGDEVKNKHKRGRKTGHSYLDEVLSKRSRKKT